MSRLSNMSIWLEILATAATGDLQKANELLELDLPTTLREFVFSGEQKRRYKGPVPDAVQRFISRLPSGEQSLAHYREDDFVDYVVDDVIATVRRTLWLIQLLQTPQADDLGKLASIFPWDPGLKRSTEWKQARIANYIGSIMAAGIDLPANPWTKTIRPSDVYSFDEANFATSSRRLQQSWDDFKEQQEIDAYYLAIIDSESADAVYAEAIDFGAISVSKIALGQDCGRDAETLMDLQILGEELSPRVTAILEDMHIRKPKDGYRPIAWHNVFWCLISDYENLKLVLHVVDPFCEFDNQLCDYIGDNYKDVTSYSRSVIYRRRTDLHSACDDAITEAIRLKFAC